MFKMKAITEKAKAQTVVAVDYGKAYFITDRRNRWVNWNGDTEVNLHFASCELSLREAEYKAESWRRQGSGFEIDEAPVICARGKSEAFIFAERRSTHPMKRWAEHFSRLTGVVTIGSVLLAVVQASRGATRVSRALLDDPSTPLAASDGTYCTRQSSPGKGGNHMGWTLRPERIDDSAVRSIAGQLQQLIMRGR
jgi:hypothetical protein